MGFGFFPMQLVQGIMDVLNTFLPHVGVLHAQLLKFASLLLFAVLFLCVSKGVRFKWRTSIVV